MQPSQKLRVHIYHVVSAPVRPSIAFLTCSNHQTCILASPVSSGWKLVPKQFPCRTAMMSSTSSSVCEEATLFGSAAPLPGSVAMISTSCPPVPFALSSTGARDGATTIPSAASPRCSPDMFGSIFSTTGARMKIALKGALSIPSSPSFAAARKRRSRLASKLSTCLPKWFLLTRISSPPMRSWPPLLVRLADSARRIKPAQVPQVGLRCILYKIVRI